MSVINESFSRDKYELTLHVCPKFGNIFLRAHIPWQEIRCPFCKEKINFLKFDKGVFLRGE